MAARKLERGDRGSVPASRTFAEMFECEASGREPLIAKSQLLRLEAAQWLTAGPKNLMLSSWKLFTKQIMTSDEMQNFASTSTSPLNAVRPPLSTTP